MVIKDNATKKEIIEYIEEQIKIFADQFEETEKDFRNNQKIQELGRILNYLLDEIVYIREEYIIKGSGEEN
ncbi:hypothetical protein [Staphylococcus coagulans]|uniref:hypothetical protein n=1 Tax=Staphylococcus coagulans TaxID=74706 RepID=UPI001F4C223B|nr:hypothetical protein [Staphylococcus coagulans]UNB46773.1 hypothetical protein KM141_02955 [Staphylococcus coagulans]